MKNIILIKLLIIFNLSCQSQTNGLTATDLSNIKINNSRLSEVLNTKGNESSIESLLNTNFQISTGEEPDHWIQFDSSKYMLLFQDGRRSNSGTIENYQLTDFLIKDNSISFTIKGVNIKIGDNISKLGNSNVLTYPDGRKEIVYKLGSQVIEIGFNQTTNLITKIKYVYYNS